MRGMTFSHYIRIRSEKKCGLTFWGSCYPVIFYIIVLQDLFKFPGSVLVLRRRVNFNFIHFNTNLEFAANFIESCNIILIKDNWMTTIPKCKCPFFSSQTVQTSKVRPRQIFSSDAILVLNVFLTGVVVTSPSLRIEVHISAFCCVTPRLNVCRLICVGGVGGTPTSTGPLTQN